MLLETFYILSFLKYPCGTLLLFVQDLNLLFTLQVSAENEEKPPLIETNHVRYLLSQHPLR